MHNQCHINSLEFMASHSHNTEFSSSYVKEALPNCFLNKSFNIRVNVPTILPIKLIQLKKIQKTGFIINLLVPNLFLKKDAVPHHNLEAKVGHVQSPDQSSELTSSARKRKCETLTRLSSIKCAKKQLFSVHDNLDDNIPSTSKQQQTQLTPTKEKHTIVTYSPSGYFDVTPQRSSITVQVDIPVRGVKQAQKNSVALQVSMPAKERKHFRSVGVNTGIRHTDKASSPVKFPKVLSMGRRNSTEYLCKKKSRFYLGLPEHVYQVVKFIIEVEKIHHVDVLITLKKIRTDDVYARLADDFEMSELYKNSFFGQVVQKLKRLPIPFRVRYKNVVSIIDCLELDIEKPSNPIHQAMTWSDVTL
ncbi:hypothetical protein NQ315_013498 [Exocentrus adspersus]|uniref:Uncharacterized protein n=1 Tax=Exocentrus adspersus TaxID=1586481 RepID=A0AAV8V974_9CUCU|nr:hypothetical protein NQ315_013498 [Exocentrus adspersus]